MIMTHIMTLRLLVKATLLSAAIAGWTASFGLDLTHQPIFTRIETKVSVLPKASFAARGDVRQFIAEMVAKHGFSETQLQALFNRISSRDDIIAKITRPVEKTKPWHAYRNIFLDEARIQGGADFWRTYHATLARAEQNYGVPPEIIVAIIGVETRYGRITGSDGVLEALATLAFDYPKRAPFFRSELEHYLLLAREENIEPLTLQGSYAGAMGLAQFMPSSYRAYAVDFDNDGHRDLWHNPVDAIGSVANYLGAHRWRRGEPIATPASIRGLDYRALLDDDLKPKYNLAKLRSLGVIPADKSAFDREDKAAILLELDGDAGLEYWLGFYNFYVITRYNRSPLYAMAVLQLSHEIRNRYAG